MIACPDQLGVATERRLRSVGADLEVLAYPEAGDPRFVDWVDYADRNSAAEPAEFLERVADRVPADATVYLVAGYTYRTFEGQCERVSALLSAERSGTQVPVGDRAQFNHAFADGNGGGHACTSPAASAWAWRAASPARA